MAKGGRPTKYKPEYCQKLIDHMAQGLSFESFAGLIDVCLDTLYEWEKKYPEFSETKKRGRRKQAIFWEGAGRDAALGKIENFNATAFVWMTKNMLGWREKQDVELSGPKGGPIQTEGVLSTYSTQDLIEMYNKQKELKNVES